jgi:uncharacterized protein
MKIAIIGGGAAGMATAYLLNKHHAVTVFEKQPILGGNIRTLNKNVTDTKLDKNIVLDNGVIEFQKQRFASFHKLMGELNVEMEEASLASELFLASGQYFQSPTAIKNSGESFHVRFREAARLFRVMGDYIRFTLVKIRSTPDSLYNKSISDYFSHSIYFTWLKMLLMYAYSIPYEKLDNFPAEIAVPLFQRSGLLIKWDRIKGGVYTYIEQILNQFNGEVHCNANIRSVLRESEGVAITMSAGDRLAFDKVVFATTPEQVLLLLEDPREAETKRFAAWKANIVTTKIHTDVSIYKRFGVSYYAEFDLFQSNLSRNCGYNAYLNRLSGVSDDVHRHYSLAFNLDNRIDPDKVIHQQEHTTPLYTVDAVRYRKEVIETNGENHTFHTGAYLDDGLQEGAIRSAYRVANLLTKGTTRL